MRAGGIAALTLVALMAVPCSGASGRTDSSDGSGSNDAIAVVGTGRVGGALGPQLPRLGHRVVCGSRDPARQHVRDLVAKPGHGATAAIPAEAARQAGIVVIATPWPATEAVVRSLDLAGEIAIDVTNPTKIGADGLMEIVVSASGGELVQSWAPKAAVVRAFNTVGYHLMANPSFASGPVTVPVAGDGRVMKLIREIGFESVDVGPLKHARHLEGMAVLHLYPHLSGHRDQAFEYHLRTGTGPREYGAVRPAE